MAAARRCDRFTIRTPSFRRRALLHRRSTGAIHFDSPLPAPELPDADYPFILLTGRGTSAQWHTGTRTNKSDILCKLAPGRVYVEINATDARRLGIESGQDVFIASRRATITAKAFVTTTVQEGQVFVSHALPRGQSTYRCRFRPAFPATELQGVCRAGGEGDGSKRWERSRAGR
jgi:anaerobic selenocysteine-containing dehydrogenase